MSGTTKQVSTTPQEIMPLRNSIIDAFMSGNIGPGMGGNMGNNPYNQSYMNAQRTVASPSAMPDVSRMLNNPMMPMAMRRSMGAVTDRAMNNWQEEQQRNAFPGVSPEFLDMLNRNLFPTTPSLDSYADPNGALFGDMQARLNAMFGQNRDIALAQAKERSGNLTGSGYASALGNVVNRSLAEQNSAVGNLLTQLAMAQYSTENANAQQAAQRFLAMLSGMAGGGVGPNTIVQSGGPGAVLGPLGGFLGFMAGGPWGAAAGSQLGGNL